jgi:acid phosphatase type 7
VEQKKHLLDLFQEKDKGISRRLFLQTCGASLVAASLPINLTKVFAANNTVPDHMTLTWDLDPRTTQTIAWCTPTNTEAGTLQIIKTITYQKNGWQKATSVQTEHELFQTNTDNVILHYATATALTPGTTYTYRAGTENSWSEPMQFSTQPEQELPFKFLVFGDSQSGQPKNPEYGPWKQTINNAYAANKDAAFFMNVGDLVEIGQDYAHWKNWYAAAKDVIEKIPSMSVPGNHETYDVPEENHSVLPIYFKKQLHLPMNGPDALKGQVYSFEYGNAHFAVMDSQFDEEHSYVDHMLELQADWLDKDLTASKKAWNIVLFHKTPYYNKATRSNEQVKAILTPIIDKHHVDLVINGHDHGYSRTYPIYQDTFVDNPAKGTIYLVAGRSGNKYYTDLSAKVWDAFFHDPQAEPNYVTITVDQHVLNINAYTQSGELIDAYCVDKQKQIDTPQTILPERSNNTLLVVWGNLLQTPLVSVYPQKISQVWHLPLRSFIEFIGGHMEDDNEGNIIASYQKTTAALKLNDTQSTLNQEDHNLTYPLTLVGDTAMISVDDINVLFNFHSRYDKTTNMLFLVK